MAIYNTKDLIYKIQHKLNKNFNQIDEYKIIEAH